MNGAADTGPAHIVIQYILPGYGEATWAIAECLNELLTVLNIYLILLLIECLTGPE